MYRIENRQAAIKQVQRFLGVNETGIYDENTQKLVAEHQRAHNITESGIVDYQTFLLLLYQYKSKIESSPDANPLFSPTFPYRLGDYDANVGIINSMLRDIFGDYKLESKPPYGDYYGDDTVLAVRRIREIFLMPESDEIDAALFNRMTATREAIASKNKFN